MTYTTPAQLAARWHRRRTSIVRVCARLKLAKVGRDYLLTPDQVRAVQRELGDRPGPKVRTKADRGTLPP